MRSTIGFRILGALAAALLAACPASAQSYEILHAFGDGQHGSLSGLTRTPDGRLWGTTSIGGKFGRGSVYVLTPDGIGGYTYEEIHVFRGPDGAEPSSPLRQAADGNLYGTTATGGSAELGTVFRIERGDRLITLHSFDGTDGAAPSGSLIQASNGFFYGLTFTGAGNAQGGTFYRIDQEGHLSVLHEFADPEGVHPSGELVQGTDGAFYGVTMDGGNDFYDAGTVFRVDAAGTLTTLHEFGLVDGTSPIGGLCLASDGNIYGATPSASGWSGTIFRVGAAGVQTIAYLDSDVGGVVSHLIQASDGFLYGTGRSYPGGSLFQVDFAGNVDPVKFFDFGEGSVGLSPVENPVGGFFAIGSSPAGRAAVLDISHAGAVTTVYEMLGRDGFYPTGSLVQASDGHVYGVTNGGGDDNSGLIYRFDPAGVYEIRHQFNSEDGGNQGHGLMQASDGNLYGTTTVGSYLGTAYRLGLDGAFATLSDFPGGPGVQTPTSGLTETPGGDFLGVSLGGTSSNGLLYRMDTDGVVTPVYDFPGVPGPFWPQDELILADDGNYYGVSGGGPQPGYGLVYRLNGSDDVTPLHEFDGINGSNPAGPLLQVSDGKLYGAAGGILYHVDLSGNFAPFHTFASGAEGEGPLGGLIESGGYLYGATSAGGAYNGGAIYRIDLDGHVESLWPLGADRGQTPAGPVLLALDGDLYGTAQYGGPAGYGVLFRYSFDTKPTVINSIWPTSGRAAGGTSVVVTGSHIPPTPGMQFGFTSGVGVTGLDAATVFAIAPALPPGTLHDISLPIPVGEATDAPAAILPKAWFAEFLDVSSTNIYHDDIEVIVRAGITAGCGSGSYCVAAPVSRAQMAVFLLKTEHGSDYVPPGCTGIFTDVPCPSPFADWIERLAAEGITAGCDPGLYCPANPVTRAQMAVFLLKTKEGPTYTPPPSTGVFGDVPADDSFAALDRRALRPRDHRRLLRFTAPLLPRERQAPAVRWPCS